MKVVLLVLAVTTFGLAHGLSDSERIDALAQELRDLRQSNEKSMNLLKSTLSATTRQMMLQQLFVEEKIRGDGNSGLKRIRHRNQGTQPYHSDSHVGGSQAAIHDHANLVNTCGMGEFSAVINGVEFRTRHNDYKIVMPHRTLHGATKEGFHKTEMLPYPEVPQAVLEKENVTEQIIEMREWFRAWRDSDHTTRDYRKHFRPILCYLEGAWMSDSDKFDESFESDRHHLDAESWFDMQEKIRFTGFSGRKSNLENYAYLPTTIISTLERQNISLPVFAQWNYRILCHPIKGEVPLTLLRPKDDFHNRMAFYRHFDDSLTSRATRYQLNPTNRTLWREQRVRRMVLDTIMEQIPGKDNYQAQLTDNAFGLAATDINTEQPLNAGYYHRVYKVEKRGAMGVSTRHRGYSDENLFAAMTTSSKVAAMNVTDCVGKGRNKKCTTYSQRWTWAIPLELVYLTPLQTWNPHNLKFHGFRRHSSPANAGGRNGGFTVDKAFNGTVQGLFYQTPVEFFTESDPSKDRADTGSGAKGVLDTEEKVHRTVSSGIRTLLPTIYGVGRLRTRYPIFPIHEEGGTAYKEMAALRELILEPEINANMYRHAPNDTSMITRYRLAPQGTHYHDVLLWPDQMASLKQGKEIRVESEEENSHTHTVDLKLDTRGRLIFRSCDGVRGKCPDGHGRILLKVTDES